MRPSPEGAELATKTDLARMMVGRALDADVPAARVTAMRRTARIASSGPGWNSPHQLRVAAASNQGVPGSTGISPPMSRPRT